MTVVGETVCSKQCWRCGEVKELCAWQTPAEREIKTLLLGRCREGEREVTSGKTCLLSKLRGVVKNASGYIF